MPPTISENFQSRSFTLGRQAVRELEWDIVGVETEDDEQTVAALLTATAPAAYLGLLLDSVNADPQGGGVWKGYARYATIEDDNEYQFDTGGGSQRITQGVPVASYAPPGATAPDFQGAINVSEDRVEGVDIVVPAFEWTETVRMSFASTSEFEDFQDVCYQLTGRTNDATFRRKAEGEVLLQQVTGGKRGDELASITFRFAASPNLTGLSLGDITGIDKGGWEYLWVHYAEFEDLAGLAIAKRPSSVHVVRVYESGDFSALGIGT